MLMEIRTMPNEFADMHLPRQRIDSHHHLWKYVESEYPWMSDDMSSLRRDYLVDELAPILEEKKIDGTVVVQACQTLEETRWLLNIARSNPVVRGVVGWVPLTSPTVQEDLESLAKDPTLRGVRHGLQGEQDPLYMTRLDFNRGVGLLKEWSLSYDLLIVSNQLPQTIQFVDRHPNQVFILDHIGKPSIQRGELAPWMKDICELARRDNVYCKISGMATEADWKTWAGRTLRPYIDVVLEAFGPHRLMFGSDWPVLLLASSYSRWMAEFEAAISSLSEDERSLILGGTASEAYRLAQPEPAMAR
jgi:L-fuconolactonase